MSSTIEIQKKCEWCGAIFTARKTTTAYCSHRCANLAYKEKKRKQKVENLQQKFTEEAKKPSRFEKEFLTPTEVAKFLGIGRTSTYRYLRIGKIKAVRFNGKTLIKRVDFDQMFDFLSVQEVSKPKQQSPITEFYTTEEIKKIFGVNESWFYKVANKHSIPKTLNRGKTYWSKKHVDKYFTKQAPDPAITEWYSVQDIIDKFGMTLSAIYTLASSTAIPKRKEGKMVYYSKKHFDIAKGIANPDEPQYYTVAEAMERYNMTRDQIYHYVKDYNIPKVREGRYTKISKPDFDKLFEAPKIE